jgi:hypothetical protein
MNLERDCVERTWYRIRILGETLEPDPILTPEMKAKGDDESGRM